MKESPEDHEFEDKIAPFLQQLVEGTPMPDGKMKVSKVHTPQLLIVAEKLPRKMIALMSQNIGVIKWVWFRPNTAGVTIKEVYKDLQSMIGGDIVDEQEGVYLKQVDARVGAEPNSEKPYKLGYAEAATISRHELVVTSDIKEKKEGEDFTEEDSKKFNRYLDRQNVVKEQINHADSEVEKEQIKARLANLINGVAAIRVMAATDQDTIEKKLRIEDAINATRAAMEEGYVPGGGVALLEAAGFPSENHGDVVLKEACQSCIRQILHNAGYEDIDKVLKTLEPGEGINVLTDQRINMKEAGIVDPLKVIRLSLIHATSVAALLLTTEKLVTVVDDETDAIKKFFAPAQ